MKQWRISLLAVALLTMPLHLQAEETIRAVPTRGEVTLSYYYNSGAAKSDKVVVMFPRGGGQGQFSLENKKIVLGEDFLVRSISRFLKGGVAVAVVGLPSDRDLMGDDFRSSEEHYTDIKALCKKLADDGYRSIYLASSGSGALSAASMANRQLPEQVKGLILAAPYDIMSLPNPSDLAMVKLPVMIIHHQEDRCEGFSINGANKIRQALPKSAKVTFVTAAGGKTGSGDECDNFSPHGLYGLEEQAVTAMLDWISAKPVPERIEGK